MFKKMMFVTISAAMFLGASNLSAFMEVPPLTAEDLHEYFERGIEEKAVYMIWYVDRFSYEEYVRFVSSPCDLQETIYHMINEEYIGIISVFDLGISYDQNLQLDRYWWKSN